MDRYQRGYDQDYDRNYRGGQRYRGAPYEPPIRSGRQDYGRDYRDRPPMPSRGYTREPWGGDYGYYGSVDRGNYGGHPGPADRYDHDFRSDRPRKSQWQTEQGDPFGDRQRHTPMRMMYGEPEWRDRGRPMRGYGRDYRGYQAWGFPQQYQPYSPESGFHID